MELLFFFKSMSRKIYGCDFSFIGEIGEIFIGICLKFCLNNCDRVFWEMRESRMDFKEIFFHQYFAFRIFFL